jgi:type IV pilus assembly protein PilV
MRIVQKAFPAKLVTGFTLIEVLVAIIVLSIGLIGIAGLLVSVIGRNQSSVYHSVAVSLATDIAERMRTNSKAFSFTAGSNSYTTQLTSGNPATYSGTDCETAGANCDSVTMAKYDAAKWEQLVGKILPGGKGVVCFDQSNATDDGDLSGTGVPLVLNNTGCDTTGNVVVIKIFWDETHSGGNASTTASGTAKNTQRYALVFQP